MSPEDFSSFLDRMETEAFGEVTHDQFFTALAGMDSSDRGKTFELTATVNKGKLVFLEPTPLPTQANTIQIGDKHLVINLVESEISDAA